MPQACLHPQVEERRSAAGSEKEEEPEEEEEEEEYDEEEEEEDDDRPAKKPRHGGFILDEAGEWPPSTFASVSQVFIFEGGFFW